MANKTKYTKKLGLEIAELYGFGRAKVEEIAERFDISVSTFYEWQHSKVEFSEAISAYAAMRRQNQAQMALNGMELLLTKHEYEEVETQYQLIKGANGQADKMIPKGVKKTKKFVMPNSQMIQYALNNILPDQFKTASKVDVTSNGESIGFTNFLMLTKPKGVEVPDKTSDGELPVEETYVPDHRE